MPWDLIIVVIAWALFAIVNFIRSAIQQYKENHIKLTEEEKQKYINVVVEQLKKYNKEHLDNPIKQVEVRFPCGDNRSIEID
jgi:hypothetical protein